MMTQQPMIMQQPMMMQHPTQQPQAQQEPEPSSDSSSSSSHENDAKYQKAADNRVTRSASVLLKLPRVRLMQLVEATSAEFDSALLSSLESEDLCRLAYITTRIRPDTKCMSLRVKTYKEWQFSRTLLFCYLVPALLLLSFSLSLFLSLSPSQRS